MQGKSCVLVLVGRNTAESRWVQYEIKKAWEDRRALLGVRIDKLKDLNGSQSAPGGNPFSRVTDESGNLLSRKVDLHEPRYSDSKEAYNYIKNNLEKWIDDAIKMRSIR